MEVLDLDQRDRGNQRIRNANDYRELVPEEGSLEWKDIQRKTSRARKGIDEIASLRLGIFNPVCCGFHDQYTPVKMTGSSISKHFPSNEE